MQFHFTTPLFTKLLDGLKRMEFRASQRSSGTDISSQVVPEYSELLLSPFTKSLGKSPCLRSPGFANPLSSISVPDHHWTAYSPDFNPMPGESWWASTNYYGPVLIFTTRSNTCWNIRYLLTIYAPTYSRIVKCQVQCNPVCIYYHLLYGMHRAHAIKFHTNSTLPCSDDKFWSVCSHFQIVVTRQTACNVALVTSPASYNRVVSLSIRKTLS